MGSSRWVFAVAFLVACGREAGPHEDEHGFVFFWQVTGSDITWGQQCSDAAAFREDLGAISFSSDSYVIYRVSEDGSEAYDQTCDALDSTTCVDGDIVFDIDGHEIFHDFEATRSPVTGDCMLDSDERWTLVDEGETLSFVSENLFTLAGPDSDCEPVQESMEEEAPNGLGIDGCLVTLGATADFYSAD